MIRIVTALQHNMAKLDKISTKEESSILAAYSNLQYSRHNSAKI